LVRHAGCGRGVAAPCLALLKLFHQFGEHQLAAGVGGKGKLPVYHLPDHLRRWVIAHQFIAGHRKRVQYLELFGEHRVLGDALRVELAIDPLLEAHRFHVLEIAGAGTEGEAVERLQDLLIAGKLLLKLAGRNRGQTDRSGQRNYHPVAHDYSLWRSKLPYGGQVAAFGVKVCIRRRA
jgi:hypothetical protein